MALPSVFDINVIQTLETRINKLTPTTGALWGKMSVSQMLAHCSVTYEMLYENKHPKPTFILKLILKLFVKKYVVTEMPYAKSSKTAPAFIITEDKNFDTEKTRLINFIKKTQSLGKSTFEGKESHSFGVLSAEEWNNMFYKHLDHHLSQFGV